MINLNKKYHGETPFLRIVKREKKNRWKSLGLNIAGVVLSLAIGAIFIGSIGINPFSFYAKVLTGCFENTIYLRGLFRLMAPMLITAIGLSLAFKMRYWNIGAEGQFLMGALMSFTVAIGLGDSLPAGLTCLIVILAGVLGGGLFGLITAVFKVKWGTNETLMTLMLNYIALYLATYFKNVSYYRVPGQRPDFVQLSESSWLPTVSLGNMELDISIFIAVALVAAAFIYNNYSKHGYEISVVGDSINTARYAGMKVNGIILRTTFLSAAIIGLAGALQVTGTAAGHTMSPGITGGVGWTAIIIAWLAKLNPIAILIVTFLISVLEKGSDVANIVFGTSVAVSDVLEGLILFTVLAFDFFANYKLIFNIKRKNKALPRDSETESAAPADAGDAACSQTASDSAETAEPALYTEVQNNG